MTKDSTWKNATDQQRQGQGAPAPSTFATDQQRKTDDAARAAERQRQLNEANKKQK